MIKKPNTSVSQPGSRRDLALTKGQIYIYRYLIAAFEQLLPLVAALR